MPRLTREFTVALSNQDRMKVRMIKDGPAIIQFAVRYQARINLKWKTISGYDNSHQSLPHQHIYHSVKGEYKRAMPTQNTNSAFTMAQQDVRQRFHEMRESYILNSKERHTS